MKRGSRIVTGFFAILSVMAASCADNGEELPTFEEQLQKDMAAIDNYLAANNILNTEQHESGIRYLIHVDSLNGVSPTRDSCVTANYKGILMSNGQMFDSGEGISFPLNEVIVGWQLAIPLLNEGDSATLYIPSVYAYGYYGYPPEIPKNANLIFNVGVKNVGSAFRTTNNTSRCE
jgi:FKBP-type peptidyl-prolyl cis-trans isomerase FkpA